MELEAEPIIAPLSRGFLSPEVALKKTTTLPVVPLVRYAPISSTLSKVCSSYPFLFSDIDRGNTR